MAAPVPLMGLQAIRSTVSVTSNSNCVAQAKAMSSGSAARMYFDPGASVDPSPARLPTSPGRGARPTGNACQQRPEPKDRGCMIGAISNWPIWWENQSTKSGPLDTRSADPSSYRRWRSRLLHHLVPSGNIDGNMVEVEGHRWAIEDTSETAKNEFGLDHNESRSWHGWHRHVSMVMLAFAMMAVIRHAPIRRRQKKPNAEPRQKPNQSHAVVHPMVNPGSPPHRHQARAKAGSNPHTSSHGHSGVELIRRSLSEPTSKRNGNCMMDSGVMKVAPTSRNTAASSCQ